MQVMHSYVEGRFKWINDDRLKFMASKTIWLECSIHSVTIEKRRKRIAGKRFLTVTAAIIQNMKSLNVFWMESQFERKLYSIELTVFVLHCLYDTTPTMSLCLAI